MTCLFQIFLQNEVYQENLKCSHSLLYIISHAKFDRMILIKKVLEKSLIKFNEDA